MPHIRVVTDSACDIPDTLLRQFDITVVPHSIEWAGLAFAEKGEASGEQLARRMRAEGGPSNWPAVEAPSVEQFARVYRSMRETCDGVLSIHTSARLSDAFANASAARDTFGPAGHGGPFPVAVVDSLSMSMGLGWLALSICNAEQSGLELPKLASLANRLAGQTHVAFYAESITGFFKTGRVPRLQPQADSLAPLKPLLHMDEGHVVVYERTRTRPKARDSLYNFVEDFPKIGEIAVIHTGALVDVEHLLTRIGAIYPRERILIIQSGPAVTAWLGPDALGVAVTEGEE